MPDPRLPITIVGIPGGEMLRFASGECIHVYGREPEVARAAKAMTQAWAGKNVPPDMSRAKRHSLIAKNFYCAAGAGSP